MATGRTQLPLYLRTYIDGYDLTGYARNAGVLGCEYEAADVTTIADSVKGYYANALTVSLGPFNGLLDNTASTGLHVIASGAGVSRVLMFPFGIRAAPAQGDPVFTFKAEQTGYTANDDGGAIAVNIPFKAADGASILAYRPWGVMLHAKGAETAVNTAIGVDDYGAATTAGGAFAYQCFTSNGTVTLKAQDAAVNADGSFSDISGATSGSINGSVTPVAGIVALSPTATVRRYLRWQLVFGTATTVTFAAAFIRG